MKVRLYGRVVGHGSHAVVTQGFRSVLESRGLLAGVYPLDVILNDDEVPEGAQAEHGVFTGPLDYLERMVVGARHARRWVMVAPNSDYLPAPLVMRLRKIATDVLVPSEWAARMIRPYLTTLQRLRVVPHGLDPVIQPSVEQDVADWKTISSGYPGTFVVQHWSTSDRQRKGTLELLKAWKLFRAGLGDPDCVARHGSITTRLVCVLDRAAKQGLVERIADEHDRDLLEGVEIQDRRELSRSEIASAYASAHLVCQPSRAEAFGMIPLEALASGVPVALSVATGHLQYLSQMPRLLQRGVYVPPGVVPIHTTDLAPIDDHPGAVAPAVSPHEIAAALRYAYDNYMSLVTCAVDNSATMRSNWSWEMQLANWVQDLKESK